VIASFPIEISDGDRAVHGYINDLSLKGVFVQCESPFVIGDMVSVLMRLGASGKEDDAPTIACEGRVLRVEGDGIAVCFNTIMGPDSYNHLRNVILYNAGDPERAAEEIASFLAENDIDA
jgi:hypothetical protein